jgi:hypothetical protein
MGLDLWLFGLASLLAQRAVADSPRWTRAVEASPNNLVHSMRHERREMGLSWG